jgi:hypothetical protein
MRKRLIPGMFCFGVVVCIALTTARTWAAPPLARAPNLKGHWDGFLIPEFMAPLGVDTIRSDVSGQIGPEIAGRGTVTSYDGHTVLDFYQFRAIVSPDDVIAGIGGPGFQYMAGEVALIQGVQGAAGIWDTEFVSLPPPGSDGGPIRSSATLLRPFPDTHAPSLAGYVAQGSFRSATDPTTTGTAALTLSSANRGAVPGVFAFTPGSHAGTPFSWNVRITTSGKNQFVMIGQGKTGRMAYFGSVIKKNGAPSQLWGVARLAFADGRIVYNTYNADLRAAAP